MVHEGTAYFGTRLDCFQSQFLATVLDTYTQIFVTLPAYTCMQLHKT